MTDTKARQAALDAAEKDGSRVKPEYGSVWYDMNGADQAHARIHVTIAVPGATTQSTGLPDTGKQGGAVLRHLRDDRIGDAVRRVQPEIRMNLCAPRERY